MPFEESQAWPIMQLEYISNLQLCFLKQIFQKQLLLNAVHLPQNLTGLPLHYMMQQQQVQQLLQL
jgi:hypothetical protein